MPSFSPPLRLDGMKIVFDKVVSATPIQWIANGKQNHHSHHRDPAMLTNDNNTEDIPIPDVPKSSGHRLSQSNLWQVQRQFFERQGVEAWNKGTVPHYITSNPFIANAYGKVVYGFLQDWYGSTLDNNRISGIFTQPVYIIELGAGSGRFAYHFLKKFFDVFRRSSLSNIPVKYVLTDFSDHNLDFWSNHPLLQPYFEQGLLDIAHFDLTQDQQLTLEYSGDHLTANTLETPLIVFANYVFDSIPQDLFSIKQGQLYETLVTVSSPSEDLEIADSEAPHLLDHLDISYDDRPITSTNYYTDPAFNTVLDYYQKNFDSTSLLFPTIALRCIVVPPKMILLANP